MKKIYLILSVFIFIFPSCDTDFDVNANWEEVTLVYGLLDSGIGEETQQIKISKAFLGKMGALQMAQYADSINFDEGELAVNVVKIKNNERIDSIVLDEVSTLRDLGVFNDSIMVYTFENSNKWLKAKTSNDDYDYELLIKNNITGNIVSSMTTIVKDFKFDMISNFPFGFIETWIAGNPTATKFSSTTVTWKDSNDDGEQYQIELIFNYKENNITKNLIYSSSVLDQTDIFEFEGERFFNFLKNELDTNPSLVREFIRIDLVMTVGSEDLKTYRIINEEITGIVQERPQFTNINNGIGLFSSRFTKTWIGEVANLAPNSINYLNSIDGLDRNFE